ncbi:LTA synthase family protein [Basilea psittacipulmonis]|uniref:LTA synthase family protein n=1 Tax=Basilea psittacipulmonis TaxID=1472345 RepID=UPI00191C303C|nr:LTA synthase family protein [Basilea psittacipulmonis]
MTAFRLGLSIWQAERVNQVQGWTNLIIQGWRIDIVSMCYLYGVPALLSVLLFYPNRLIGKVWRYILSLWLTISSVFILFMEVSTPAFIETYDFRPNRLFVEYLLYPKEVFTMLTHGHLTAVILSSLSLLLSIYVYWKIAKWACKEVHPISWKWQPIVSVLIIVIAFLGARSSLGHRGINPAMVAFSPDPLVNSLVLNSGYSVLYAVQQLKDEEHSSTQYGKMSAQEMFQILKKHNYRSNEDYIDPNLPTLSVNPASYQGKPRNIVILLQESLGAQFIGALGGLPLSPNFDELSQQGWLFENIYATGTRSVRGIEAVMTGFTPTPARAVVKLEKSQRNFFTIAELLKNQGYQTTFIYGGEKHFDNMASFFYGNGFQTVIDENDYPNPKFKATWGVSDEDLFDKAHDYFTEQAAKNQPFFALVFSSSNHDPFEFPDGKIELYEQPKQTRRNAAKYADYAIGHFFKLAKSSNYWDNTIFIIIADHDSRVAGETLVPIKHFHIPALILGKDVPVKRDPRLVSQIDIPPTLLSLAGINATYPMIGFDLTKDVDPNRAIMQYDQTQAFMSGKDVVIMKPKVPAQGFVYDKSRETLTPTSLSSDLQNEALAYALFGSYMYKNQLYRLPEQK